jgi:predicted GH43/DUF377 family glycosyl hydrolase
MDLVPELLEHPFLKFGRHCHFLLSRHGVRIVRNRGAAIRGQAKERSVVPTERKQPNFGSAARVLMRTMALTRMAAAVAACAISLALAGPALACSKDDTSYLDGFLDTDCLETPLANTVLDTFGGLRLTTNGAPVSSTWETASDFDNGISWQAKTFAPVGVESLATDAAGGTGPGRLTLPTTLLPLARDTAADAYPGIPTADPTSRDSDNVDDPSVIFKTGFAGGPFVMYYAGTAEDGTGPAIFIATSANGTSWTRANGGDPVLDASSDPTAFDARGVAGPDVVYDPADASAPFKMWYSGIGDVFGAIGYATSTDGLTWTRYDDAGTPADDDPVLDHGEAGSPDSFAAADPAVLKDGETWKMWYTGDDSNKKRIAYATSPDGISWTKGGKVISPEDPGANANYQFGAFAPTVWKTANGFNMLLAGRKNLGTATAPVFQTRVMRASSSDGIDWSAPSPEINPQSSRFYSSNLNAPFVVTPPAGTSDPYRMYFSGNSIDANGNFHTRIGIATSANGNAFTQQSGPGALNCGQCVLDIGLLSTSFDARQASGLSAVTTGGTTKFAGFYWGTRGSDFKPRLGEATSADGSTWSKVPVTGAAGGAVFALGGNNTFDQNGQRDPSTWLESSTYQLYFTAINGSGVASIGRATASTTAGSLVPDNSTWTSPAQIVLPTFGGYTAVSHPSVIHDGATWVMYFTGTASGVTTIDRMTSASPDFTTPTDSSVTFTGSDNCAPDGARDPVVQKAGAGDYRMLYTGVEKLEGKTIERGCYATSADGLTWARQGIVLNPSQTAFSSDEVGVEPTGLAVDGTTLHVWYSGLGRTGRTLGDHATTAFPTPNSAAAGVENGSATYQLGDETTAVQDWRQITRSSTGGSDVQLWMSYEQPYSTSGAGGQFWSAWFPVTQSATTEQLKFLLTVRGVRWQARMATPADNPALDTVSIDHAPVSFNSSGNAVTKEIGGPSAQTITQWRTLTVSASSFSPANTGSASGTVKVLSADQATQLASASLNTGGDTTIDLSSISASSNPTLRVRFDLASDGNASPLVTALKVAYFTNVSDPGTVTLSATPTTVDPGGAVTLSGNVSKGGTPVASAAVSLQQQPNGAAGFTSVGNATTDAGGNFSLVVNPATTTVYRASYSGSLSPQVTVTVNPPKLLTLTATPAEVIFGQTSTLGGNLSQGGAPLAATAVDLLQQPAGATAFTSFGSATSDAAGNWSSVVTPQSNTTYEANSAGIATPPTASVSVHQKVTLKATRRLKTGTFKGSIAPAHPGRDVVIQLKKGTSFVTFAKAKTTATSSFSVKKALKPCGKFQFRAVTAADADHLDGTSLVALVEKHRVSMRVKVKGRKATITGKVSPAHRSGTVLIKEIRGKRAVKLGKAKITKKSTFKLVLKLKKGKHTLRADVASDKCHFGGTSALRKVTAK